MATKVTDSGWSWVIAGACCWVTFVIQGLVRCSGVVYVALIDAYGVNRAQASWPFTLRMAIWNLSGPIAGALSYRWSIRTITITGVLLVTLTNMCCWFASDIYMVTLFLGGLQGVGVGLAVTLVPVIINQYFVQYKSTGAGIACAGATAGSFALPPIVELAVEEFGLRGAFLMMAGITLHGVLGGALMRPAAWLTTIGGKNSKRTALENKCGDQNLNFLTSKNTNILGMEEVKSLLGGAKDGKASVNGIHISEESNKSIENGTVTHGLLVAAHSSQRDELTSVCVPDEHVISPNGDLDTDDEAVAFISSNKHAVVLQLSSSSSSSAQKYGKLQFLESEYDPHINIQQVHGHSKKNIASERHPDLHLTASESEKKQKLKRKFRSLTEPLRAAGEILKNPMFLIIATNYCIFFLSYMTYLIVIVDYSLDLGVDRTDSVFLVSTFSIADLCGRLGSGWITDSGILKRKHLMMGNMLAVGGLLITTSFTTSYAAVTAVSAVTGLLVGINLIIFYALLEEYLGLKQLPMAIGLMNFSIGVVSLITPVLTGYFRDTMGSYDHLFHFLGSAAILCGLLWFLEPIYRTCKKHSNTEEQEPS